MSTRVPPKTGQANQAAQQQRLRRTTRPQATEKPKPIKAASAQDSGEAMSPEAALWAGQDIDRSLEIRASDVEGRMAELAQSDEAQKDEGAEHAGELHEQAEKEDGKGFLKMFSWKSNLKQPAAQKPPQNPLLQKQPQAQQQGTGKLPAFRQQQGTSGPQGAQKPTSSSSPNLTGVSSSRLQAVGQVQNALTGRLANERPPDAFTLLKEAREKGILFVEDALAEGHNEELEDPELRAAVEECIRLCFGLRGILRIGPGHNDKAEPIIVVATTHGFSDASLAVVPEKVHRFPTLIAIPFDLLPLKRER